MLEKLVLSIFYQNYDRCATREEICLVNFEQAIIDFSKENQLIYTVLHIDELDDELVDLAVTSFFKEFSSLLINNRLPFYLEKNKVMFKNLKFIQEKIYEILKINNNSS